MGQSIHHFQVNTSSPFVLRYLRVRLCLWLSIHVPLLGIRRISKIRELPGNLWDYKGRIAIDDPIRSQPIWIISLGLISGGIHCDDWWVPLPLLTDAAA